MDKVLFDFFTISFAGAVSQRWDVEGGPEGRFVAGVDIGYIGGSFGVASDELYAAGQQYLFSPFCICLHTVLVGAIVAGAPGAAADDNVPCRGYPFVVERGLVEIYAAVYGEAGRSRTGVVAFRGECCREGQLHDRSGYGERHSDRAMGRVRVAGFSADHHATVDGRRDPAIDEDGSCHTQQREVESVEYVGADAIGGGDSVCAGAEWSIAAMVSFGGGDVQPAGR